MAHYAPDADHPLLSPEARARFAADAEALTAYADEAEAVLNISEPGLFDAGQLDRVKGAVARQMSTLLEFDPLSVLVDSDARGARSRRYKPGVVNPLARAVIDELLGRANDAATGLRPYAPIRSHRGRGT